MNTFRETVSKCVLFIADKLLPYVKPLVVKLISSPTRVECCTQQNPVDRNKLCFKILYINVMPTMAQEGNYRCNYKGRRAPKLVICALLLSAIILYTPINIYCPPQSLPPTHTTIHYYISMASITSHPSSTLLLHSAKPRFVWLHLHYPHHHLVTSSNGNIVLLYWPFVRRIHPPWVKSPHKGQWRGALTFYLICAWINSWEKQNNDEAADLRRHRAHFDVTLMIQALLLHACHP